MIPVLRRSALLVMAALCAVAPVARGQVGASSPGDSRTIFRLAQQSDSPTEALRWYREYVAAEPTDPWGYMAVGDALSQLRRYAEALRWYDQAARRAPGERDVAIGQARVLQRANRLDAAAEVYRDWLVSHESDGEAWRELGRVELKSGRPGAAVRALRRAVALEPGGPTSARLALARALAAPRVEPVVGGSRDSDGNVVSWVGLKADVAGGDGSRVGLVGEHSSLADGLDTGSSDRLMVSAGWRPRATLRLDASAGVHRVESSAAVRAPGAYPAADLRMRFRTPGAGPRVDLRAERQVLALSPVLIANRVTRSEVSGRVELPIGPIALRGVGRAGVLTAGSQGNHRGVFGGGVALPLGSAAELSGGYQRVTYAEASNAGYFAPRLAEVVEAASYAEVEPLPKWSLALDAGAGVQRAAEHGAGVGSWRSAFRLYALSTVTLVPGRDLRLEVEAYDAPLATAVALTSQAWRWGSVNLSLRWALP